MDDDCTTSTASEGGPTLTIEALRRIMRDMPIAPRNPMRLDPLPFGMPVFEIHHPQQVIVGYETVRSPGHPFIKWLAKFIPFEPDVVFEVPVYGPAPFAYKFGSSLFMTRQNINGLISLSSVA